MTTPVESLPGGIVPSLIQRLENLPSACLPGDEELPFFARPSWFACLARYGLLHEANICCPAVKAGSGEDDAILAYFVGDWNRKRRTLSSLTNYYSVYHPGCAGVQNLSPEQQELWLRMLRRHTPGVALLEADYLPAESASTIAQIAALRRAGFVVDIQHKAWNWHESVADKSFAEYWCERPGQLRSTVERRERRLAKKHRVTVCIVDSADGLENVLADYQSVYARSWKRPEAPAGFISALVALAARCGALRLAVLYVDDIPAAAQMWIVDRGIATIYKLAHDKRFDNDSVGSVLTKHLFARMIDEEGVSTIDYGVGDEPYKRLWMTRRRQLVSVCAADPRTSQGLLRLFRWRLRDVGRRLGLRPAAGV